MSDPERPVGEPDPEEVYPAASELDEQQKSMGSASQREAQHSEPARDDDDQQIAMGSSAQGLNTEEGA